MPLLLILLAVCGLALSAIGAGPHGSGVIDGPPGAAQSPGGRSFTIMTFNIQHGIDGTHQYNLQRAVDVIARLQPDLVGLQEVTRNHSKYRCDDQPAVIAEGLKRATGRRWHHVYVQEWFVNEDRKCLENGTGDGPNTEGLAFLSPEPMSGVAHQELWNGRLGLAVRVPAAGGVPVIVTHLSNSRRLQPDRVKQLNRLLPWAEAQGTPRLFIGDLNARPGAPELEPVLQAYRDAWAEGKSAGTSRGVTNGATHVSGSARVDYIFFTPGLQLEWVEAVDTSALIGVHASDHHPVIGSFRLP